jgi:hypothetical protein
MGREPQASGKGTDAQRVCLAQQSLAALLDCMERIITQSAPTPAPLPGVAILLLCTRILSLDDSVLAHGDAHAMLMQCSCQSLMMKCTMHSAFPDVCLKEQARPAGVATTHNVFMPNISL